MIIPHDQLQPSTLTALIEEFITRDGSIQGHSEKTMEDKIALVMRQLQSGEVAIVFDPDDETCSIAPKNSLGREHRNR